MSKRSRHCPFEVDLPRDSRYYNYKIARSLRAENGDLTKKKINYFYHKKKKPFTELKRKNYFKEPCMSLEKSAMKD